MSSITSIIVINNSLKDSDLETKLNNHFADESQFDNAPFVKVSGFPFNVREIYGEIFVKACNGIDIDLFLTWLISQEYYHPELISVLIMPSHPVKSYDDTYHHKTFKELIDTKVWREVGWG